MGKVAAVAAITNGELCYGNACDTTTNIPPFIKKGGRGISKYANK